MRLLTLIAILLMTGCATVQEFVQDPPDAQLTLKLPPEQAAVCMTRNQEKKGSGFIADRRPLPTGQWEMVIRTQDTIYTVATLTPQNSGSQATIWMAAHMFVSKESIIADMVAGC